MSGGSDRRVRLVAPVATAGADHPGCDRVLSDRKSVLLLTGANGAASALGFATAVLVARRLGPELMGVFTAGLTWAVVAASLADCGLLTATVRYGSLYETTDREQATGLFTIVLRLRLLIAGLLLAGSALFKGPVARSVLPVADGTVITIATAAGCAQSLWQALVGYLRSRRSFGRLALITPMPNAVKLAGVAAVLVWLGWREVNLTLGVYALAPFLCAVPLLLIAYPRIWGKCGAFHRGLISLAGLTLLMQLANTITAKLDVFMLSRFSSRSELGCYGAAAQLALAVGVVSAAIEAVILPRVSSLTDVGAIRDYLRRAIPWAAAMAVGIAGVSLAPAWRPALLWVLGSEYGGSLVPFRLLLASQALALAAAMLYPVLYPLHKPQVLTLVSYVRLPLALGLHRALVPPLGAAGAGLAVLLTAALCLSLTSVLIAVHLRAAVRHGLTTPPT